MKTLIILTNFVLLSGYVLAQNGAINVIFEVDGKRSAYKNAIVKFISSQDTVRVSIKDGKLAIPASISKQKATVIFYIDGYVLKFSSIPVTWNSLNPKWTAGVDMRPFDKEKFTTIRAWKKVEIIYYLKNEDGRTFTVDGCKKSEVIRK